MAELKTKYKISIVVAVIGVVGNVMGYFVSTTLQKEVATLENIDQQVTINVVSTLKENMQVDVSANADLITSTDELIAAYNKVIEDKERLETEYEMNQGSLQSQIENLKSQNRDLQSQVQNLKAVLLNTYTMDEIDTVVEQGILEKTSIKRLDNLECLDSESCERVSSVKDLYGTTHSVSYRFDAWGAAWAKFKLDGNFDTFTANIVTSDATDRNTNMSVEIYVDDILVSRVDDIVRDEHVRPISASVNGGKVLMIKVIRTNNRSNNICYITDTSLSVLN